MSTFAKKIAIITSLRFSYHLRNLKVFLDLIDWLRFFVTRYAQLTLLLQKRKITLIKNISIRRSVKKREALKVYLKHSIVKKLEAFRKLQRAFETSTFLTHYDRLRRLYIDLNVFKQWEFVVMIYHVLNDSFDDAHYARIAMQSIMFLSKCLNSVEKNYWFTKLKIANIIWVIRKIKHLTNFIEIFSMIIYIDHSAAMLISRQTTLITSSTNKLNLRLVRASQYLSAFNLFIRHKTRKTNIVSNALSRLQANMNISIEKKLDVLESLYDHSIESLNCDLSIVEIVAINHVTLIQIIDDFKLRLKQIYRDDSHWNKILTMITDFESIQRIITNHESLLQVARAKIDAVDDVINITKTLVDTIEASRDIRFIERDELLYYIAFEDRERLCILKSIEDEVFKQTHDLYYHDNFHRTYDRLCSFVYIRNMIKRLRVYISHCLECQLNQTKRHLIYEELTSIVTSVISFHFIAMNFIVGLPSVTALDLNVLLITTCKFIKKILLLARKNTWKATN